MKIFIELKVEMENFRWALWEIPQWGFKGSKAI